EGVVASDNPPYLLDPTGWFLQGSPEQWQRFELATVGVLARIHAIDDAEDLAFLRPAAPGTTMLERQVNGQRAYYEWARDGLVIPALERALEVLARTVPPNERAVLNWGDSRPGNIIYRDFQPVAVLDWEMATVGPPEVDLGWATFFQRFFAHMAQQWGLPPVPAMFERPLVVARYEELSGTTLDDLAWYEAFAGLRFGTILARMSLRNIAFGVQARPADTDDLVMFPRLLENLVEEVSGR
ncbi:MAG TPA: phosphotransferase family protein, partial [Acidimicrobiales bacterium]|nr:phosphotransferase family protein [Acidimicrobiales bacterium]